ncbi:hypothetical protein PoB_005815100 [Plakobranchus ocellatus]|uniref:Uncharacterized protein n=1 Tax=Plakobranchus ocellatus TaxID=259542 RepID=A0AAV4C8L4_9GAST|nr:hypothetical protein PoB_005815100 [Plakobranchus ocellatus]
MVATAHTSSYSAQKSCLIMSVFTYRLNAFYVWVFVCYRNPTRSEVICWTSCRGACPVPGLRLQQSGLCQFSGSIQQNTAFLLSPVGSLGLGQLERVE